MKTKEEIEKLSEELYSMDSIGEENATDDDCMRRRWLESRINTLMKAQTGCLAPAYSHEEVETAFSTYQQIGNEAESVDDLESVEIDPDLTEKENALLQLFCSMDATRCTGRG
tara:strand:- start:1286 stop:1624 length:339 start_codon:yes stop_codon:yes gene_type:complete